jgi:hypothetical protein
MQFSTFRTSIQFNDLSDVHRAKVFTSRGGAGRCRSRSGAREVPWTGQVTWRLGCSIQVKELERRVERCANNIFLIQEETPTVPIAQVREAGPALLVAGIQCTGTIDIHRPSRSPARGVSVASKSRP